jgi:mono/diheme cytochrome c family protein
MNPSQARAILAYMRKIRAGGGPPAALGAAARTATLVLGRYCANCHMIDGEGGNEGPDLTRAGKEHDVKWLHDWIRDPEAMDPLANMPAFGDRLTPEELTAISNFLAARK